MGAEEQTGSSAVAMTGLGPRVLKGGGHIKVVWTYGVGPQAGQIRNFRIDRGRFINAADNSPGVDTGVPS